jgi:uncharacterized protein (DUF58 family)
MPDDYSAMLIRGEQIGSRYALTMPRRVPMGLAGSQVGHHAGSSLEFKEHREYMPGDDLRRIDWSAYARSDRLHVMLYREEVSPHVDLLLDGSASMALTGAGCRLRRRRIQQRVHPRRPYRPRRMSQRHQRP